ncbi:MAG TPA: hypothetical protein PKH77_23880 [Anaerolineae bacterium]|nr:hypothetical protein [Anaerolineae bacterium]
MAQTRADHGTDERPGGGQGGKFGEPAALALSLPPELAHDRRGAEERHLPGQKVVAISVLFQVTAFKPQRAQFGGTVLPVHTGEYSTFVPLYVVVCAAPVQLFGHSSVATTTRYRHPDAGRVQEMVEEL